MPSRQRRIAVLGAALCLATIMAAPVSATTPGKNGKGGLDLILAGPGNDKVKGGPGDDTLVGDLGNDRLDGGTGKDRCLQGPGTGSLISC